MAFSRDIRGWKVGRKLSLVVSLFVLIVVFVFLLGTSRSMILSSVRAYIQGEGYWSKAQKEAVISLARYTRSRSEVDFQAYLAALDVILGDRAARLELEKPSPDIQMVFQGYQRGKNDPGDIPDMIRFFRWFHGISYIRQSISICREADSGIDQLSTLADQMHAEILSDHADSGRLNRILEQVEASDSRLTVLENRFSASLAEGDRWIRNVLNALTITTSLLLLVLGISYATLLLRGLERSEQKYHRLLDSASDAILVLDACSGVILEANERASQLLGIPTARLIGMRDSALYPRGESQPIDEILRTAFSGPTGTSREVKLRRPDGRSINAGVASRLLEIDDKKIVLAILRDLTELQRVNRALLALSRCNQELVRTTSESELLEKICAIIVKNGGYRMAWVGFPLNDEEKSVRVAAQSGDTAGYLQSIRVSWQAPPPGRGLAGRAIHSSEVCILHNIREDAPTGLWTSQALEQNFRSVIALPLMGEKGVFGALSIYSEEENVFDAEEVKLLSELATNLAYGISTLRLRAERERAEAEVRSLEEQLRHAQKMEALGRLAGGVAHDFNNLLMVIRGYAEMAMPSDRDTNDLRRKISEIMKASERAQALVGQLLAFSRKQILQPRVLDLNSILLDLGAVLPRLIGEDIQLRIRPGADVGLIKADPNQIQQAILNLAINARDAMPEGGTLTIQASNVPAPRSSGHGTNSSRVLLAVCDTGSGIPPEIRAHIFEPFFTTKEHGKGTGLGLSMVYGTVTQSGGHIEVESETGKGTTFKIFFPATDETPPRPRSEMAGSAKERASETILLVEDEPSLRDLVSHYLENAGYTVITAVDGEDGLKKAASNTGPIHILVTDVVMPSMGGRELAEQLRLNHPESRILFMSGYTDDVVIRRNISDQHNFFIEKPFQLQSLSLKIREVLHSSR
jgi:PAS domain S-box-containing protein